MNKITIAVVCMSWAWGTGAQAQAVFASEPLKFTLEGFINGTLGHSGQAGQRPAGDSRNTQADAGLRLLGEYAIAPQRVVGVRVEANASPEEHASVGERSLLYIDSLGRLELGRRRGLPDSLVGYAPNTYAFTSAEFGVTSGRTLDPGGTLASGFLPSSLRTRIDAISGNGASSAFFGDTSPKVLYVSPKKYGLELGVSYAPKIDAGSGAANPYKELLQTGLAYQADFGQDFFRVGGSYSRASANKDAVAGPAAPLLRNLNSLSVGTELNLGEVWDFGINLSHNGGAAGATVDAPSHGARGVTASANYNNGKWVGGGYLQRATAGNNPAGRDVLSVFQLGAAYRIDTKLRLYTAFYHYRLSNDGLGQTVAPSSFRGNVVLAGVRWTL